jgi:hypothetical protein
MQWASEGSPLSFARYSTGKYYRIGQCVSVRAEPSNDAGAGSLRKTSDGTGFWKTQPKDTVPAAIASAKAVLAASRELPQQIVGAGCVKSHRQYERTHEKRRLHFIAVKRKIRIQCLAMS